MIWIIKACIHFCGWRFASFSVLDWTYRYERFMEHDMVERMSKWKWIWLWVCRQRFQNLELFRPLLDDSIYWKIVALDMNWFLAVLPQPLIIVISIAVWVTSNFYLDKGAVNVLFNLTSTFYILLSWEFHAWLNNPLKNVLLGSLAILAGSNLEWPSIWILYVIYAIILQWIERNLFWQWMKLNLSLIINLNLLLLITEEKRSIKYCQVSVKIPTCPSC